MEYRTKDFYLGCSMLSKGIKLIDSEKDRESNSVFFIFDITDKEEIKNDVVEGFLNQNCYVNVKKFTYAIKILRNEINKYK
jgi:hypothetical protein